MRVKLQHSLAREVLGQLREEEGIARPTSHVLASPGPHMGLGPEMLDQGRM